MKISIEGGRLVIESGALLSKRTQEIPIPQIKKISKEGMILKTWTVSTTGGRWYKLPSTPANDSVISQLRAIMDGQNQAQYRNPQAPSFNVQMIQPQSPQSNQPPQIQRIEKEVVKLRCAHCRTLNPDTNQTCLNCGARL